MEKKGSIGVFDSGFGGLTILKEIIKVMPEYDFLFLGDNARAPYGTRSFDIVYEYTRQCAKYLMDRNCPLVILACNTASAKALRTIQQKDLPMWEPQNRVLGIIRPTVENILQRTKTKHIGLFGTSGTINSKTYPLEFAKTDPEVVVNGCACPMWVPLVENGEYDSPGADYFIEKKVNELMEMDPLIDTIILGCTHYPVLQHKIEKYVPSNVTVVPQGKIVADSLKDYLCRHPEMDERLSKYGEGRFLTTESVEKFQASAKIFLNTDKTIDAHRIIF